MTNNLGKAEREAIVSKVMTTVEMKHYDPHFAKDRWRALVEERRADIIASGDSADFESSLADLVRSVGTPDSGFFHESSSQEGAEGARGPIPVLPAERMRSSLHPAIGRR